MPVKSHRAIHHKKCIAFNLVKVSNGTRRPLFQFKPFTCESFSPTKGWKQS